MPPKTVKCSVCGQEVLKAQTLARADGTRACRSHPGVEEEGQKLKDKEHERREKETKPAYNSHSKFMQRCAGLQTNLFPRKADDILAEAAKFREEALEPYRPGTTTFSIALNDMDTSEKMIRRIIETISGNREGFHV